MKQSGPGLAPDSGPSLSQSPSFNGYSSGTMAEIAARVVSEFAEDNGDTYYYQDDDDDIFCSSPALYHLHRNGVVVDETKPENLEEEEDDDDCEFEFAVPGRGESSSPVSADEIFCNGQIRPLFPIFNTDLVVADTDWRDAFQFDGENCLMLPQPHLPASEMEESSNSRATEAIPIRLPLKKLMISERGTSVGESASCSSSEADELEGVAPETYCVWAPQKQEMRKKSKSTGWSSKRWKFRDLLHRSHSDRGDALFFLTSKQQHDHGKAPAKERSSSGDGTKKKGEADKAQENKATRESDRKRSNLPHRQDMVGFFANMNGLSSTIQPF